FPIAVEAQEFGGRVVDLQRAIIAGALVQLNCSDTSLTTLTDAHGEFRFPTDGEDCVLSVSYRGFETLTIKTGVNIFRELELRVASAKQSVDVNTPRQNSISI